MKLLFESASDVTLSLEYYVFEITNPGITRKAKTEQGMKKKTRQSVNSDPAFLMYSQATLLRTANTEIE